MAKRPSLFTTKSATRETVVVEPPPIPREAPSRPPSRAGKRVVSIYLDPLAQKQLRQLALDTDTTTQALGEEAFNLLFAKHRVNRSA